MPDPQDCTNRRAIVAASLSAVATGALSAQAKDKTASSKNKKGKLGPTGPTGPVGPTGPASSSNGAEHAGPTGPQGAQGPTGPQGLAGAAGAAGPPGPTTGNFAGQQVVDFRLRTMTVTCKSSPDTAEILLSTAESGSVIFLVSDTDVGSVSATATLPSPTAPGVTYTFVPTVLSNTTAPDGSGDNLLHIQTRPGSNQAINGNKNTVVSIPIGTIRGANAVPTYVTAVSDTEWCIARTWF